MVFPVPVPTRCRGRGNGNEEGGRRGGAEAGLSEPINSRTVKRLRRRRSEPVAGGIVQEAPGGSERVQSFVERGVSYATEQAQLTERHWTAGRFEGGGDAFLDGERDGNRLVWPVEYTEGERGAVLLELECEDGR